MFYTWITAALSIFHETDSKHRIDFRAMKSIFNMGVIVLLVCGLGGCAAAPKYRTGSDRRPPSGSSTQPNTPDRLPRYSTSSGRVPDGPERWGDHYLRGLASWYGQDFHGRKTASGEVYDMYKLTAAHRTLPLGTRARIWNVENGRSCIVKINDRGPFIEGRILDLSYAAALELLMAEKGIARIQIEILKLPELLDTLSVRIELIPRRPDGP